MNYIEYIHSGVWKARSAEAIRKTKYLCQKCGNIGRLQAHHLNYERLGAELDTDLLVVCEKCHKEIHGIAWRDKGGSCE